MARITPDHYLKKPGRILTWHAGAHCRSHKTSQREDYFTVLPKELAPFLHMIGSDTTEGEVLEFFLSEMLHELARLEVEAEELYRGDPLIPKMPAGAVLFEIRGFFHHHLEFSVTQHAMPATDPFRKAPEPRWLMLANQNVRDPERCGAAFDELLDRCDRVARSHDLVLDMTMARHGFRTMLRRKLADSAGPPTLLSPLHGDRFGDPSYAAQTPAVPVQ